jgi:hypothetical protein
MIDDVMVSRAARLLVLVVLFEGVNGCAGDPVGSVDEELDGAPDANDADSSTNPVGDGAAETTCPGVACPAGEVCRDGGCVVEAEPDGGAPSSGALVVAIVGAGAAAGTDDQLVIRVNDSDVGFIGASPAANSSPQTLALPLSAEDRYAPDDRLVHSTTSNNLTASFSRIVNVPVPDTDHVAEEPGLVLVTAVPSSQVTVIVEGQPAGYVSAMYAGQRTGIVPVSSGETWRASISGNTEESLVMWAPMERRAFIYFSPPEVRDFETEYVAESDGYLSLTPGPIDPSSRESHLTLTVDGVVAAYVGVHDNQYALSEGPQMITMPIMTGQRWRASATVGSPGTAVWRAVGEKPFN